MVVRAGVMVEYYIELVYSFYLIVKKANNFLKIIEKKNKKIGVTA